MPSITNNNQPKDNAIRTQEKDSEKETRFLHSIFRHNKTAAVEERSTSDSKIETTEKKHTYFHDPVERTKDGLSERMNWHNVWRSGIVIGFVGAGMWATALIIDIINQLVNTTVAFSLTDLIPGIIVDLVGFIVILVGMMGTIKD